MAEPQESFGERNFGGADLGDARRSQRLPKLVDEMARHPGGSLPQKLPNPEDLASFYRLCEAEDVTHEAVLAPHRQKTLQVLQSTDQYVLAIHDATELDYSTHHSVKDQLGQIGNGGNRGYIVQNVLVVDPHQGAVVGLANQILHRRVDVPKGEKQSQRRERETRESRLWLQGTRDLPQRSEVVDVCDRGADTFEFLEHEAGSGRSFVIRSAHSRAVQIGHDEGGASGLLHEHARTRPALASCEVAVSQKRVEKKPKRKGKKIVAIRTKRVARLEVSAAPVLVQAPASKNGEHGNAPLALWIVRVWEPSPPAGEDPLEWLLLTNHPVETGADALRIQNWYEWRWTVEELHKAQKTGCHIEGLQFKSTDRLEPAIAVVSVLALTLLALRDACRHPDAARRRASEIISNEYIVVLSLWREGKACPNWTIQQFMWALGRLGGHPGRKKGPPPGWIVLWRGWEKLQLMVDGVRLAMRAEQRKAQRCA